MSLSFPHSGNPHYYDISHSNDARIKEINKKLDEIDKRTRIYKWTAAAAALTVVSAKCFYYFAVFLFSDENDGKAQEAFNILKNKKKLFVIIEARYTSKLTRLFNKTLFQEREKLIKEKEELNAEIESPELKQEREGYDFSQQMLGDKLREVSEED